MVRDRAVRSVVAPPDRPPPVPISRASRQEYRMSRTKFNDAALDGDDFGDVVLAETTTATASATPPKPRKVDPPADGKPRYALTDYPEYRDAVENLEVLKGRL